MIVNWWRSCDENKKINMLTSVKMALLDDSSAFFPNTPKIVKIRQTAVNI